MIEFESVSKTFRDGTTAVDDLSLVVPSGKITVIVGPSGCGKTTTLRMVNRMLEPTKGKITWDDKPIKSRRKTTLRRQMGYVIQSGGLFPHRTVLENISTVPDLLKWDKQKSRKRATELLGSVGLDRKLGHRYPAQLSGGQQQRVGVARALAADPLVLLMDEPFSAVDPVVRGELHEFFLGLQRQLSKTIIMITHDIDEAIRLGDQVAILRVGGRLAQVGTPQQLLDEPADAFVEGFVGKDRGYRSLSFQPASGLSLGDVQVVREAGSAGGRSGPVLVVDADAQPVGWADPARPGTVTALGATFDPEADSLRTALDAALTSPVGLAVAVSGDPRRYAGVVDVEMILRQVTQTRAQIAESIAVRAHDAPTASAAAPGPSEGPATHAADEVAPPSDDPDATSVRGVPPVETTAAVGTVTTAGVVAREDGDPGAAEPEVAGLDAAGSDAGPDPTVADDPDATRIAPPQAAEPLDADTGSADPYGAEAPSTEDETVGTAYDAQLAADESLADHPHPGPPQPEETQPVETQPAEPVAAPDVREQDASSEWPADEQPAPDQRRPAAEWPADEQPTSVEQQPEPRDQPPAERPADSDEDDREPPR